MVKFTSDYKCAFLNFCQFVRFYFKKRRENVSKIWGGEVKILFVIDVSVIILKFQLYFS